MSGAILFDLDGTLVDSERESAEAMVRALAKHGVFADTADRDYIVGRSWVDIFRQLKSRYRICRGRYRSSSKRPRPSAS